MAPIEPVVTAPTLDLTPQDVAGLVDELRAYHALYAPLFQRQEQRDWAEQYLRGLLSALPRKSVEPMVLAVVGADRNAVRGMQQFLSAGPWDDAAILRRHWQEVEQTLGADDGVLTLDGSDFPKQGRESVGVKRQYCGQLGKRANCQAGVFLGYASTRGYTLLDRRLYVPEEWLADAAYAARRDACGLPADTVFQTKPALGGAMIAAVRRAGHGAARPDRRAGAVVLRRGAARHPRVAGPPGHGRPRVVGAWTQTDPGAGDGPGGRPADRGRGGRGAARPRLVTAGHHGREQRPDHRRLRAAVGGGGARWPAGSGRLADPAAHPRDRRTQDLPEQRADRDPADHAGAGERDALAHRALLRGGPAAPRPGGLRGALLARLASPPHPRHPRPLLPHAASMPVGGKRHRR